METSYCLSSVKALNNLLSDQYVLMTKVLNFHWNVEGRAFMSDHKFFESLYNEALENADDIAERIRIIGGRPIASLHGFLEHNRIKEHSEEQPTPTASEMYKILAEDYQHLIDEIAQDLENLEKSDCTNLGTTSYLEDFMTRLQKTTWMIRMHIEK